ncbi:hypothetical protein EPN15_03545 [Patescibacteria group bacterium]|nr:MAG: hypothetical protein EPN15_03545 [Patescibacteria group bacterium]
MFKLVFGIVAIFLLTMAIKWIIPNREKPLTHEQKMRMAIEKNRKEALRKRSGLLSGRRVNRHT